VTYALAFALVLAAPGAAQTSAPAPADAVLRPGDGLEITVWRKPEFTGEFDIAADGSIRHPLYRSVSVAGLPFAAVEQRVREYLGRFEEQPQIVIKPLFSVAVGGEVRDPKLYRFPPEVTVAQAVAAAGGITAQGRIQAVELWRGGRRHLVNLTYPDAAAAAFSVHSGDQIIVQRRVNVFREYIAPAGTIFSALVALTALLVRERNN
jgi:polysaccharide export outer membrane protein